MSVKRRESRGRRAGVALLAMAAVFAPFLAYVWSHLQIVGTGYRIEATETAQDAWAEHVAEVGAQSLFGRANSWYVGANIPGKPRVVMPYAGGQPMYRERVEAAVKAGYAGFALRD